MTSGACCQILHRFVADPSLPSVTSVKKSMNEMTSFWVESGGSIFTVEHFKIKLENGKFIEQPKSIAFNVGTEIAKHICDLHNHKLVEQYIDKLHKHQLTRKQLMDILGYDNDVQLDTAIENLGVKCPYCGRACGVNCDCKS